jgi:hypothetical protein
MGMRFLLNNPGLYYSGIIARILSAFCIRLRGRPCQGADGAELFFRRMRQSQGYRWEIGALLNPFEPACRQRKVHVPAIALAQPQTRRAIQQIALRHRLVRSDDQCV